MLTYIITEEHNIQIQDEKFKSLINPDLQKIIQALESNGFEIRIVGGAVRDILLGDAPRDIDLLTNATPDEVMYSLSENEIEADVWGIRHGTVKAVIGDTKYDITTIDYQIKKDKSGRIHIQSGNSWEDDAKRRDFTMNAMSMDLNGKVYDYLGGINDLKDQIIRPIPSFEDKMLHDPVLILRFFKLAAKLPKPRFSKSTINTILKHAKMLKMLDKERIEKELANIKGGINAKAVLAKMEKLGILKILNDALVK